MASSPREDTIDVVNYSWAALGYVSTPAGYV